jgi:hypothetical protein
MDAMAAHRNPGASPEELRIVSVLKGVFMA